MRDILVTGLILGAIPFILRHPRIGVLMALWISLMSPHRFSWGFAYDFPFVAITIVATLVGTVITRDPVRLPRQAIIGMLIILVCWMSVTAVLALEPESASTQWMKVMKMFAIVLLTAAVLNSRRDLDWLVWVIVLSIGYFGVKGGIFTLATGGAHRVYGPPGGSYVSDNNAISVALVMTIPLMHYLRQVTSSKWLSRGLLIAMILSGVAILGSQSRGALLAVTAMGFFLWLKARNKAPIAIAVLALVIVAMTVMPDTWLRRMQSIENYQEDRSAQGRINTWTAAFNVANDRLTGGGFEWYSLRTFSQYAPDPTDVHSAHSIYFQVLGEHGYVGLLIFLFLAALSWKAAGHVIRTARANPSIQWAGNLAVAVQVSLIGYAAGGAFVNITYWDLPYLEIIILMILVVQVSSPAPASARRGDVVTLKPTS